VAGRSVVGRANHLRHTGERRQPSAGRVQSGEWPRVDALIAAALLALAQAESWLGPSASGQRVETAIAAAVATTALAWRRRAPLAVLAAVMVSFGALSVVAELPVAVFVLPTALLAIYSVAAFATTEQAVIGLALSLAMLGVSTAEAEDATVTDLTAPALLFVAAWAIGRHLRARRLREAVLDREADARERAAAAAERRRIARELHDIVAHRVSTVVIQAEAGLMTADDPQAARDALGAIRDSGRQALGELRRLLGLLQEDAGDAPTAPQPSLGSLAELIDGVRGAGLPVELRVDGELTGLEPSTDLAAFRIVQEALTNALRHARTATTVEVRRAASGVTVEVRNPLAPGATAFDGGSGCGLAGMRERVRVFGGTLVAASDGAEFVVRAVIPEDVEP
jgi:signal transduction histidine kinase